MEAVSVGAFDRRDEILGYFLDVGKHVPSIQFSYGFLHLRESLLPCLRD